jgi:thioesterase domain-containing protein
VGTGAEVMPVALKEDFYRQFNAHLYDCYGPTETTIAVTYWDCSRNDHSLTVPIGRPIANTRIHILDRRLQPVPVGVPGELHIGGECLAAGYFNRPDLTAEKFIPDPFSEEPGERLYKTGDLARYLPDGVIEFLGRMDDQIKIRGFRVEPEEIEAAIGRHEAVRSVAVTVREGGPGDKRLVAYVVGKKDFTPADLRDYLRNKLPNYMIPSAFVCLDSLPLTPNGKVDRLALSRIEPSAEAAGTMVAPRDKVERRLTKIWENALGTGPIGIRDNFFDLGGHSLLAALVAAKIKKRFGRDVSMDIVFMAPTIEQLAEIIRGKVTSEIRSALIPFQTAGSRPPFFWVHGGAKGFLHRHLGADQPFFGVLHVGRDGRAAAQTSIETMAAHYLREIRTVQPEGPCFLGGYCFSSLVALEMAQQLKKEGRDVPLLVLVEPSLRCIPHLPETVLRGYPQGQPHCGLIDGFIRVLRSARNAGREMAGSLTRRGQMLLCEAFFRSGRPLPHRLRQFYMEEILFRATRAYTALSYPGSVLIFHTKDLPRISRQQWSLLSPEVEVHEVRKAKHTTIMKEPHVGEWGRTLRAYLEKL